MKKYFIVFLLILTASPLSTPAATLSIISDNYQYAAAYTDPESHMQYLNARYYNPALNRFIQRDSCKLDNRYQYADSNPIRNIDPSGHSSLVTYLLSATGATGAGAAGYLRFIKKTEKDKSVVKRLLSIEMLPEGPLVLIAEISATNGAILNFVSDKASGANQQHLETGAQGSAIVSVVFAAFSVTHPAAEYLLE